MKRLRLLFVACCIVTFCNAQEIKVKTIELLRTDISARTNPRLDGNDEPCALIKVIVPAVEGMQFGGWVIGNIGYLPGEYHVYVPAGTKKITFRHPDYAPGEIRFTIPIEGKCTYRVTLDVPQKEKGLKSVEQGDAASMLKMAQNYEKGTGAYSKNMQQALEWYEKAAEAGNVEAQEYIAEVLYAGKNGFRKDVNKALKWNDVCAKRGNETAIYRLAELHKGLGLNEQAIVWYKKYNELHPSQNIQYQLAQLYDNNHPDRNKWLKIAADNGHVEAAYELATRLAPTDHQTAAIYYQKAVDANHAMAKNDYGTYLITGKYGFIKDEAKGKALIGSLGAQSTELKTEDAKMAPYIAQIPDLLQAVKHGDADAILKLILIYSAVGDNLMVNKMRLIALYNFSYKEVPLPKSYDPFLSKKADIQYWQRKTAPHLLIGDTNFARLIPFLMGKIPDVSGLKTYEANDAVINDFRNMCDKTRYAIDRIFRYRQITDGNIDCFAEIYNFANRLGEESCQRFLLQQNGNISFYRLGVDENSVLTSFQKQLLQQRLSHNQNMLDKKQYLSKYHKKQLIEENKIISELLKGANKTETIKNGEWLRQLKVEGYFWTPEVAANAKKIGKNK